MKMRLFCYDWVPAKKLSLNTQYIVHPRPGDALPICMPDYSGEQVGGKPLFALGVEKAVHMHYKIAHVGVIDSLLCL